MKTGIILACTVAVLLCLFLLLRNTKRQVSDEKRLPDMGAIGQAVNESVQAQVQETNRPANSPNNAPASLVAHFTPQNSNEFYQQFMAEWQAPIDFYGKVVDENGRPIAGATVQFHWPEFPTHDGSKTATAESGLDGLFSLQGKRGPSLTVWVSKQGYYASHGGQQGFSFALGPQRYLPDPQNPIIFKLRKRGAGAELVTSQSGSQTDLTLRVPKDSTPVRVDFFQRKVANSGQLEISQIKPPWRDADTWSFTMSIPDGGLIETTDEFPFEAPETNYSPRVDLKFSKGETNWGTHLKKSFYVAFGVPRRYGVIQVETDLSQESVFLTYSINPSGSHNLEPISNGRQ